MDDQELEATRGKIKTLGVLYGVLFFGSLAVLVYQATTKNFGGPTIAFWAVLLGSAVAIRLYRNSLVNKYNSEIAARRGSPTSLR